MRRTLLRLALPPLALLALAGCGSADPGPPTGSHVPRAQKPFALDAATGLLGCLTGARLPAKRVSAQLIQIGPPADGVKVIVAQTFGQAELDQIQGRAEGAEVVNRLEFFPGNAAESEVGAIEGCVNAHSTDSN